jgi:hypothetical protein
MRMRLGSAIPDLIIAPPLSETPSHTRLPHRRVAFAPKQKRAGIAPRAPLISY